MNEQAFKDLYAEFKKTGYSGTEADFKVLMSTNSDAFNDGFSQFTNTGYDGDADAFAQLIGVGNPLKKKIESDFIAQDQDGGLVTEDISSATQPQTEQDYFEGTFGDILRGFDAVTQAGLGDFVDDMARSVATGYYQGQVAEDASDILLRGANATDEDIYSFIEANKEAQKLGPSDEMMAYQKTYEENGKGFMGVIMGLYESGLQVIPEVILSSLTSMLTNKDSLVAAGTVLGSGTAVGAGSGAVAGGVGAIPGAIAGAAATLPYAAAAAGSVLEMGATFSELLQEEIEGELTPEKIREAISNEEIYTSIRNKALARGITIGVIDAFTGRLGGKVAGKILSKAGKGATKGTKIKSVLAASGVESVGGSVGESAGIGVTNIDLLGKTKGQEFDISEIALEGIAEAPGGIKDVISARFSKPKYRVNGKKVDVETIDNLIETMTLDQLQSTKIKIDNDYEGRADKLSDRILQLNTERLILEANPDINPETLAEITKLQLNLSKLEGNKTEVAKEKASILKAKIKDLQENQLEAEVDTEVDAFRELEQSEQLKYIEQASKELVEESEAKGDEEFEITEQQNLERAVELFNKDQQTETDTEVEVTPEAEVKVDDEVVYEMNKTNKKTWSKDFEIIDNRQGQEEALFDEEGNKTSDKWWIVNKVTGQIIEVGTKAMAKDVIANAPAYAEAFGDGTKVEANMLVTPAPAPAPKAEVKVEEQAEVEVAPTSKNERVNQVVELSPNFREDNGEVIMGGISVKVKDLLAMTDNQFNDFVKDVTKRFKLKKQVTKVEKQVDNARKALNKLDKDIKIVVHNDDASYRKATGEDTREQSTRGEYNPTTKTIHINTTKVQDNTVAHEVFHALLLRNGITNKQAKAITDRMLKAVKKTASPELLQKLKEHSDNYDSALQSEESIAELFGILASEYKSLDKPTQNLVQRWINKLASILGVKKFTDAEVIDLLNVVSAKVEAGQEITEQDVEILEVEEQGGSGQVGTFTFKDRKQKAPNIKDDTRDYAKNIIQKDLQDYRGQNFVTNMYDFTNSGPTNIGAGIVLDLYGGKNYVADMMEKTGTKLGEVSNVAAFNTKVQAEGFIKNAIDGNANLFAPHVGTKEGSWQFQQNIFEQLTEKLLDNNILTNQELIESFNDGLKSKNGQSALNIFNKKYKKNLTNLNEFKDNPKRLVELLDIDNNYSPDLRKILNDKIASNKKVQAALGVKNKIQFAELLEDPMNVGSKKFDIIGLVEFDNTTFETPSRPKKGDADYHPSFAWTVKAKVKTIVQPTNFYQSTEVTDSYTKFNKSGAVVSTRENTKDFKSSNVSSSAGSGPKVATVKAEIKKDAPQSRKQKTIQQAARDFNMSETGFFPRNVDSYFLKRAISRAEGDYGVKKARTGSFFLVDGKGGIVKDLFKRPQSRKQKPSKKPTRKRTSSIKKAITEIKNVLNITPDEQRKIFKALNDQKKIAKDIKKDIVASLRELTKEGKITPSKMVSVINKVPDDFNNPITVERFVEYMTKVFNDADYGNKMMIANANKSKARKNVSTKLGIAEGLVDQLQRLFSVKPSLIPDSVLDQYMELINIFGKRETVLSLPPMEQVIQLTEDVLQQLDEEQSMAIELADRYENTEKIMGDNGVDYAATIKQMLDNEVITEREYEVMKKYKSQIKPAEPATPKTEAEIEAERQSVIEDINETKEVDPSVFPSRLERDLAKRFKKLLKTDAVNDLSLDDLKNLFKVIDNINNGYLPHYAQIMVGKMNAINDAKLGSNAIKRSKLLPLSKIYANLKSKFGKTGKTPTSELQRRNPTFYIDQVFGDFKTKDIFNSIFKRSAEASAKYTKAIKEVQAKIEKVEQAVFKSFGRNPNKVTMSKYKQMSYLIQQEFLSNPDSKQVNSVEDFLKATIKRIKTETTSYTEADAIMLQEILDKYTANGTKPFDIDQLYESFNVAERNSIRALEEINKSMTDKAVYTANIIRGNKITPLKNYTHLSVIPDVSKSDIIETETSQISDMFNKYLKPSTKAKSLIERTGKVSPLNFDVYASVQRGAKYTLMDFNLTEPIRTARRTLNQIEKNLSEEDGNMSVSNRRKFNAIRDASVEHIENLLSNALTQNTLADQTIDYIQKQGYRAILAGVPRASWELLSNVLAGVFIDPKGIISGIKNRKLLASPEGKQVMNNLNSTQTNRVFSTGLSGKFVDTGILNQAAGVTAGRAKGRVKNTILQLWNKTGQRWIKGVEFTADSLISAPDKLVMQPMWFGAFENRFKQLTGKSPDFDKIAANDEAYMDKYATELNDAKTLADNRSVAMGATDNAFMGILKGTVKPNQGMLLRGFNAFNGFMTRFLIFEYITARTGIMAAVGNGQINKRQGAALLAGVTTRMIAYTFMGTLVAEAIKDLTEDDDDEDIDISNFQFEDDDEQGMKSVDKMLGQAMLSAFTSLALGRDFGNATKSIINLGIEDLNERYGQFLRDGEYDKYRDAIQYTIIPEGKSGRPAQFADIAPNLFAAYSPMIKTLEFGINKIFESDRVQPDAIERQQDERFIRLPLETFGVLGFIPFYKDVRKIVLGNMYKDLRKAKKDAANKKKRKEEMLQGYSSETDMKRYDFPLWERTFGPDSPGYETRQAEKELKRKARKLRQQEKDKMYDYTPSKKEKNSSLFGPSTKRKSKSSSKLF